MDNIRKPQQPASIGLSRSSQAVRITKAKVTQDYHTHNPRAEEVSPAVLAVSQIWRSIGDPSAVNKAEYLVKIDLTADLLEEYFSSDASPAARLQNIEEKQALVDLTKRGGLLNQDLKDPKFFDSPPLLVNVTKNLTHYLAEMDKVSRSEPERALASLAELPRKIEDFQCAGGLGGRLLQARNLLLSMPDRVLRGPYQSIKEQMHSSLVGKVPEGNEVHIPQAIDFLLFGLPVDLVLQVDPHFSFVFENIPASMVWDRYKQSLKMGVEVGDTIKTQAQLAVVARTADQTEYFSTSITSSNENLYLKPWGIERQDLYQPELGLFDDFDPVKKEGESDNEFSTRLKDAIALMMSDKLNQCIFDDNQQQHIDWLSISSPALNNDLDFGSFSRESSREWICDQINQSLSRETPNEGLDVALNALRILSESVKDNRPITVLKTLHDLGGGDANSVERGLQRLEGVSMLYSDTRDVVRRIDSNTASYLDSKYQKYIDFLQKGASPPLLMMFSDGGSIEELCHAVPKCSPNTLNEKDEDGLSLLHRVIEETDYSEVLDVLLTQSGVNINIQDARGLTPVHLAVSTNNIGALNKFIHTEGINVAIGDQQDFTPLMFAAERGHLQAVDALLNSGESSINEWDEQGRTALNIAVRCGQADVVELLLSQANIAVNHTDHNHSTPLLLAVKLDSLDITQRLLAHSDNEINTGDRRWRTPLRFAVERGDLAMINTLLASSRLDLNKSDQRGASPFSVAVNTGKTEIVRAMLNYQVHPQQTALDINAKDIREIPMLHIAVYKDHIDIVELLLNEPGYDINAVDYEQETVLFQAVDNNNPEIVNLLANHNCIEIDKADAEGKTPLWVAAEKGCSDIVQILLGHWANSDAKGGTRNLTPLQIARERGHNGIVELLTQYQRFLQYSVSSQDQTSSDPNLRRDREDSHDTNPSKRSHR